MAFARGLNDLSPEILSLIWKFVPIDLLYTSYSILMTLIDSYQPSINELKHILQEIKERYPLYVFEHYKLYEVSDNSKCILFLIETNIKMLLKKLSINLEEMSTFNIIMLVKELNKLTKDISVFAFIAVPSLLDKYKFLTKYKGIHDVIPLYTVLKYKLIIYHSNSLIDFNLTPEIIQLYTEPNKELINRLLKHSIYLYDMNEFGLKLIELYATPINIEFINRLIEQYTILSLITKCVPVLIDYYTTPDNKNLIHELFKLYKYDMLVNISDICILLKLYTTSYQYEKEMVNSSIMKRTKLLDIINSFKRFNFVRAFY